MQTSKGMPCASATRNVYISAVFCPQRNESEIHEKARGEMAVCYLLTCQSSCAQTVLELQRAVMNF